MKQALAAGKHVVCEKPLAVTSEQSAELVELAERSGLVHCTNFNIRFYPIVQEARERVRAGEIGDVWNVHGGYLQDWLALPTDWNWRLEPEKAGELRAVGDIGSHWLDLVQFVTGLRVTEVFADLVDGAIPVRQRPVGEVETFARADDVAARGRAHVDRGHRAHPRPLRQRRSRVVRRLAGLDGPQELGPLRGGRLGRRTSLGRRAARGALAGSPRDAERGAAAKPGADAPGSGGAARTCRSPMPRASRTRSASSTGPCTRTWRAARPAAEPDYPTFRDGHVENVLADAVARSHRERSWVTVELPRDVSRTRRRRARPCAP